MTATSLFLFNDLTARGFTISAQDGALFVKPSSKLLAADRTAIIAARDEFLAFVSAPIPMPSLREDGSLHIPFAAHPKYQHWAGGQSIFRTLEELNAPMTSWQKHAERDEKLLTSEHEQRCGKPVTQKTDFAYCAACGYYLENQ